MDVQKSPTLWILPGQLRLMSSLGSIRYEMFPGKREAREGRREQEGRCPRKLHESLRESRSLREGLREGPLSSCSRERKEQAGPSGNLRGREDEPPHSHLLNPPLFVIFPPFAPQLHHQKGAACLC